ncbi:hypothetical protein Tco_0968088 [Tanacetum coccineum]
MAIFQRSSNGRSDTDHLCLIKLELHHGNNVFDLLSGLGINKGRPESQLMMTFEQLSSEQRLKNHSCYYVSAVKLNKGLKDSNFDQLYAYLKQHEAHANENKMMLERLTQQTVDPLALMSNVSPQHYHSQSSTNPPTTYHQPHSADTSQSDLGLSPTDNLIENLTNTLALLTQSYKTFLPQTNNQLRTSSNPRNQATVQDGRVVVQNVQGRQNRGQGNNARGAGATGYEGAQNRVGNANPGQARQMLLMQAQENGVALDEEQLLFLAVDDCDAYDSDVDEAPTAQTMFMANLSSVDPVYDEVGPSYDSDILSEVQDHDHFQDAIYEHHEEHGMQDDVQPSYVVDSHADYTSDSNMTPYDQYVKDNAVPVVQNNASTVPNDMYVMIDNDLHEPKAQSVFKAPTYTVADNSLNAELAIYKEQVELYERRARFELTEREQKIDEQLRIVICDRNIKEENLKKELHSVKLQLASTIQHNKLMVDEVTSLKKDFNQKENKYLEEFLDLKALKDKVEDKLFKQGQSIQTVHMMCKPRSYYDEVNKVAIGYKNPLCLHRARQVQPALYSGHVIVTPNHAPAVVRDGEETLELTEISRKKMHDKMKANECVDNKVNITPPNYSKENFLATFTPQKQLTPEQIFWSQDIVKMKAEALKEQNTRPIKALTVYPPNTPATLVPRVLPTKSQVKINIFTLRQLFSEFEKTCKKRITPTGITEGERGFEQTKTCYLTEVIPFFKTLQEHFEGIQKALTKEVKEMSDAFDELEAELDQSIVDRKHDEIERKNLLIEHDNIIADGLSKEVFYVASNSELNVSRFTEMQKAHNVVKARCLELEAELSNLRDNIHKDNYNELLNRFSNLEVNHLNLQLKYQNLKDSFQNKPSSSVNDTPDFNSVFVIGQMKASLQGKDNVIQKLKMQISQLKETRSELDRTLDFRARDFQISQLTEKVNGLQEQNELFRAENAKIKQHYKELYDSIKITRAKHTEQITALKNENESLKVQLQNTVSCVTTNQTSDGMAVIQPQLNNIGREIKKVNEKVYAAQVGYEQCKGPHYTKDCPQKEEAPVYYQRNKANPSYQERRQSMEDALSKFLSESAKTHEENSNLIKEIRATTDVAIRNQGASIKTLEIHIGQMSKLIRTRYAVLDHPNTPYPLDRTVHCCTCQGKRQFLFQVVWIIITVKKKRGTMDQNSRKLMELYISITPYPERASVSVMPLSTYLNLGLGELAHTRLTVELADRTVKYPKGIAKGLLKSN